MKERSILQSKKQVVDERHLADDQKPSTEEENQPKYNEKLMMIRERFENEVQYLKEAKTLKSQNQSTGCQKVSKQFHQVPKSIFIEQYQRILKQQNQDENSKMRHKQLNYNEQKNMIKRNIYYYKLLILSQKQKDYNKMKRKLQDIVQQQLGDATRIQEQDLTIKQLEEKERRIQEKISNLIIRMNKNNKKISQDEELLVTQPYMRDQVFSSTSQILKKQHDLLIKVSLLISYMVSIFICMIFFTWKRE